LVQKYAPEIEKRLRWQWRRPQSTSRRVDETYVKVRGEWVYLYRTLDKYGNTIDFYLSPTRNSKAAWNGANDLIYFGKGGEMASNRADDQEISMLSLRLAARRRSRRRTDSIFLRQSKCSRDAIHF
jgi:hypothetical protein